MSESTVDPKTVLAQSVGRAGEGEDYSPMCHWCHRLTSFDGGLYAPYYHEPSCPVPALAASIRQADDLRARVEALEVAIRQALDDEETGKWGPDVTIALKLAAALAAAGTSQTPA